MVFDLLRDGERSSAPSESIRGGQDDRLSGKERHPGHGCTDRLYPSPVPGWMASTPNCLTLTGDGRAMTYRAGGTFVGPESPKRHMGPRYFGRFGQATWVGVLRDPQGKPIGPYVTKPDRTYGDMTMEVRSSILEDYFKSGRGPVYMDCRGITEEDYEYMMRPLCTKG